MLLRTLTGLTASIQSENGRFRSGVGDLAGELALKPPIAVERSPSTSVALGPTEFSVRQTIHLGAAARIMTHYQVNVNLAAAPIDRGSLGSQHRSLGPVPDLGG